MRPRRSIFFKLSRPRRWTLVSVLKDERLVSTRRSSFKTEMRRSKKTSRDRLKTEMQDQDVPKNVSRPQCRNLKTPTGEVSLSTTCFVRVRSIIFFVIYSHCMHVHKTKVTRPRRYIFKTETLNPQDRDETRRSTFKTETRRSKKRLETASRPRRSRPRLHPCNAVFASTMQIKNWKTASSIYTVNAYRRITHTRDTNSKLGRIIQSNY